MKPSTVCSDPQQQKINNMKSTLSKLMVAVDQSDNECAGLKKDIRRLQDDLKEMNKPKHVMQ